MPDEQLSDDPVQIFKQALAFFADAFVRVHAIQIALHERKVLEHSEVEGVIGRLKQVPSIRAMLEAYPSPPSDLDRLLREYEGPVQ